MTDRIEPALTLTAEEWVNGTEQSKYPLRWHLVHRSRYAEAEGEVTHYWCNTGADVPLELSALLATIAMCNAALPAGHPQKITREWATELRAVAEQLPTMGAGPNGEDIPDPTLTRMADALESYLPPQ